MILSPHAGSALIPDAEQSEDPTGAGAGTHAPSQLPMSGELCDALPARSARESEMLGRVPVKSHA